MKSEFIRNEWVGNKETITIMSEKKKPKYRLVVLMTDHGDFEIDYEFVDDSDFELERDNGTLHVVFSAPFNSERRALRVMRRIIKYCENDERRVCNRFYCVPVSVIEDAISKCKNMLRFNYPQIDRFDLVEELHEH